MKSTIFAKMTLPVLLLTGLTACGGSDDNDSQSSAETKYNYSYIYQRVPNIANCDAGELTDNEKMLALNEINAIRKQHGLNAVSYDNSADNQVMQASLMTVANNALEHDRKANDKCWSNDGNIGSQKSNLYIRYSNNSHNSTSFASTDIVGWLIDERVEILGHRRSLLNPYLTKIAYGRVDGTPLVSSKWKNVVGASLKVIYDEKPILNSTSVDYVAYPYHNYPKKWFKHDWYQSFTVVADKTSQWGLNERVNFKNAQITVKDSKGNRLAVTAIQTNNNSYGVANVLQWKTIGTKDHEKYSVNISNVIVNGQVKSYDYWFSMQ